MSACFAMRFNWPHRILPSLLLLVAILVTGCVSAKPENPTRQPLPSDKQKLAEDAVDLLQRRFYETLEFESIWKEAYVTDSRLRSLEVEAIMFKYIAEAKEPVSHEAKERAYVAIGNFWHTFSAARFTSSGLQEKLRDELTGPYEAFTGRGKPFANERELDQDLTGAMNRMSAILRKHVVRDGFGSPEYKAKVAQFKEDEAADPERIKNIFIPAGLNKDAKIYVVDREVFHYYLIEEQDTFKVLTILLRRRF